MSKGKKDKILTIEYPYYNIEYKLKKKRVKELLSEFSEKILYERPDDFNKNIKKCANKYFIIIDNWELNNELNSLTDCFTESVRVKCSFGKHMSPLEYWAKFKQIIIDKTIKKYKKLSIFNLRETIYFNTKLCNNFRISVCLPVLKHFKVESWLDISAGWGDRLMSALLYGVKRYVASDPNKDLHPHYDKMIKMFKKKDTNYYIYEGGFENIDLDNELFDIVFSSPPFFTLEKYSTYNDNSITKYSDKSGWCKHFLLPSLVKCYNHVKLNGHILLYMGGDDYIMQNMHRLGKVMDYKGVIYFYDTKLRAMYLWQKRKNNKINIRDLQ